jgi:hypothetical protein
MGLKKSLLPLVVQRLNLVVQVQKLDPKGFAYIDGGKEYGPVHVELFQIAKIQTVAGVGGVSQRKTPEDLPDIVHDPGLYLSSYNHGKGGQVDLAGVKAVVHKTPEHLFQLEQAGGIRKVDSDDVVAHFLLLTILIS